MAGGRMRRVDQEIYDLLISIDEGHLATEDEKKMLSSVSELKWGGVSKLPKNMGMLESLSSLNLFNIQVSDISVLSKLTSLSELDLSDTRVSDISVLSKLISLSYLNLSGSQVRDISVLSKLASLSILFLGYTQVSNISALSNLTSLSVLYLRDTQVSNISALSNLTSLSVLYLGDTQVSDISALSNLTSLSKFDLRGSQVRDINALSNLTSLSELDLSDTQVSDIKALSKLTSLSVLYLKDTQVRDISALSNLTSLSELDLRGTQVRDISALSKLKSLSELDLRGTQVRDISALSKLTSMSYLDLRNSRVSDIRALSGLKALKGLDLSGLEIKDISALSGLTSLAALNLQDSKTTAIPESILGLNLGFITDDKSFVSLYSNKGIFIHGLTLTDQPTEIFSQKIDLIRAYYRERKQVPVNECKVIFLGDAETGKTHSIRRLLNDGKKLRKFDGESTPGIETTVSRIKIKDSEITVNYWDFGGQEIQHSMHRAFLTERTVYVVFLNARQDDLMDERARYWMENIKAFAPNAPVLVVINKIDQNKNPRFNENGILESYSGQVKKVIRISAKKDNRQDFLGKLQGNINSIVMELPTVSKKIPYSWKALMENIREMKDHYLTAEQFIDKCKTNRIKDYKEIHDELVDLFQVIGVSFCYYKNRSIADYMLLNPKWMLNALYTIVTNGKIVSKNGIISQGHLFDLLKEDIIKETPINRVIPDLRYDGTEINFILGVIRMFRLSYHLQDGSEFFPMLCDGNEKKPVTEVPENALHFIFKYDYLPTNVMHRLIVEMQRDIDYENVWYTGAVFRNESQNQTAYIRSLKNDLHIYVYGEEEFFSFNEYLTPIQNIVRYINKSLGISAEEYLTYRLNGAETEILYDEVKGNLRNQLYTRYDARIRGVIDYRVISHRYYYESHNTDAVLQSIINALEKLQNDSTYYRKKNQNSKDLEDSRNRFVSGHLNTAGYLCNDQQTGGISPSGESAGERDFVVRDKSGRDILIYEGLNLNSLRKDYLDLHIKKLIDNYNPLGLRQGVLVTYLECGKDKYLGFTDRYRKHISEFAPGLYRCVGEPRDIPFKGQFMTCMVMNYEIGGVHFEIDHLIVRVAELEPAISSRRMHKGGSESKLVIRQRGVRHDKTSKI